MAYTPFGFSAPEPKRKNKGPKPESRLLGPELTPENYILLPGRTHGSYSYTDLLVGKQRLSANPLVEATARKIGLKNIENTALVADGYA